MTETTPTPDQLLADTDWVRGFVSQLVRDEEAAEDVSQEVLLAGLLHPVKTTRSWLARVAENKAASHYRSQERRDRRELQAARPERLPSTSQVVERFSTFQTVVQAVMRLEEPTRTTVLMRFWEGKAPREIAEAMSVPTETVRTRLKRGLAKLRTQLDEQHDSRMAWAGPLMGMCDLWPVAPGGLLGLALAAAMILLSFGGIGVWMWGGGEAVPDSIESALVESETADAAQPEAIERQYQERHELAVRGSLDAELRRIKITGRCVAQESGLPLAGCEVVLLRSRALEETGDQRVPGPVLTGADGRFELSFEAVEDVIRYSLTLGGEGRALERTTWLYLEPGVVADLGDVGMRHGARVYGRVVDTQGVPQSDVRLYLSGRSRSLSGGRTRTDSMGSAVSGPDGSFELDSFMVPGTWHLMLLGISHELSGSHLVTVPAGMEEFVTNIVVCDTEDVIAGVVYDSRGLTVSGCHISVTSAEGRRLGYLRSGVDGRFRCSRRDGFGDSVRLTAYSTAVGAEPVACAWGQADVVLKVPVRGSVGQAEVVVVTADGEPVDAFGILHHRDGAYIDLRQVLSVDAKGHEGGVAFLTGLKVGAHVLRVHPADSTLCASGEVSFTITEVGQTQRLRVVVDHLRQRQVEVVDPLGRPVVASSVEVLRPFGRGPFDESTRIVAEAELTTATRESLNRSLLGRISKAQTDAEGMATLIGPGGEGFVIRVRAPGYETELLMDCELAEEMRPLRIVLDAASIVSGVVRGLHKVVQEPPAWFAQREKEEGIARFADLPALCLREIGGQRQLPAGLKHGLPLAMGGSFSFDDVPAGDWAVYLRRTRPDSLLGISFFDEHLGNILGVQAGQDREAHFDVGFGRFGEISGRVFVDGIESSNHMIALRRFRGDDPSMKPERFLQSIGEDGVFSAIGLPPGKYELSVTSVGESDGRRSTILADYPIPVAEDEHVDRVFELTRRQLKIRLVNVAGEPMVGAKLRVTMRPGTLAQRILAVFTASETGLILISPVSLGEIEVSLLQDVDTNPKNDRQREMARVQPVLGAEGIGGRVVPVGQAGRLSSSRQLILGRVVVDGSLRAQEVQFVVPVSDGGR